MKNRIIFSALLMTIVLLPLVGLTIINAYEQHMAASLQNELKAYSYSILAVAEVENQQLLMPDVLLENQFNASQSGLYAFFTSASNGKKTLWRSSSLLAMNLPSDIILPKLGESRFYPSEIEQQAHSIYSFTVDFESQESSMPLTLHIIKQQSETNDLLAQFQRKLWLVLLILIVCLLGFQFIWLMWSLKPLSDLKAELADIEQGKTDALKQNYPKELSQVTTQLNALLKAEQKQRSRYRNALSDLAHSLKTPLAVIKSHKNLTVEINEQVDNMNNMVEHQLKRAQSAGHASWHLGTSVKACVDKLLPSLAKIYLDKSLNFIVELDQQAIFKGDEADLLEILGNLLDNACKAAGTTVSLIVCTKANTLSFIIEDDGVGIDDNLKAEILKRGTRIDTYQQGHGIGLAIVRDLVTSYQGELIIARSAKLSGAKFTLVF